MQVKIANKDLRESDLPRPEGGWLEIGKSVLFLNGCERCWLFQDWALCRTGQPSFERVSSSSRDASDTSGPYEEARLYISAPVEGIRRRVCESKETEEE